MDDNALQDSRAIIVTGGGRGIGAATARLAAAQGWRVAVNYREDHRSAQRVVDAICAAGGTAIAVQADVSDEAQTLAMFERVDAELGLLGGLVNSAGVVDRALPLAEQGVARWRRMFDINVIGTLLCAREAVRRMSTLRGGAGGSIVNVSSGAARIGSPNEYVDYAASKGAIDTLTIGLAKEVAGEGIRVNAVRPGLIETDIHASGGRPDRVALLAPQVPIGRGGSPEEVAEAIAWLLSDKASYTTMALIDVTGGR